MSIIEKLAEIEHDQWRTWAHRLLATEPNLTEQRKKRWEELMCNYDELPEEWKEFDRQWALKVYEACKEYFTQADTVKIP